MYVSLCVLDLYFQVNYNCLYTVVLVLYLVNTVGLYKKVQRDIIQGV